MIKNTSCHAFIAIPAKWECRAIIFLFMKPILVLCGPTASGKTALSLAIAESIDAEIISADSRQVYKDMDIGTAKPSPLERQFRPHHLIDVANPGEDYSAGRFARDAQDAIHAIYSRGKTPVVVGGSGLYLRALIEGLSPMPEIPDEVRRCVKAEIEAAGPEKAHQRLKKVDPEAANKIKPNDRMRIGRALEISAVSHMPLSKLQNQPRLRLPYRWWIVYLDRKRPALYARINQRTLAMVEAGLFEEVRGLLEHYDEGLNALNTVGYKESIDFLRGRCGRERAIALIQQNTRHYAKRQETWFRKARIDWRSHEGGNEAKAIIRSWQEGAGLVAPAKGS